MELVKHAACGDCCARMIDCLKHLAPDRHRCSAWIVGEDGAICPSLERAADLTLAAPSDFKADSAVGDDLVLARQLLLAAPRVTEKTEFRSPPPPFELSFAVG